MKLVKLTYNYDWPIFRQTPKSLGVWRDYQFVVDDNLKECDFWVIYSDHNLGVKECYCNKNNIIFIPGEGPETFPKYPKKFFNQFGKVITVNRDIKGDNVVYWQNGLPWFLEQSYDELKDLSIPKKEKLLSIISSNKTFTEGHKKRLEFAINLKKVFGDKVDLYGRGINSFENKWEVLVPYRYHICIENDFIEDYFTEKLFDPLLTFTYPIYYGCPNIDNYFPSDSLAKIDINDFETSCKIINDIITNENRYNRFLKTISDVRNLLLNNYQLFPMLANFLDQMDSNAPKEKCRISEMKLHMLFKKILTSR